jgi:hypothetical protein
MFTKKERKSEFKKSYGGERSCPNLVRGLRLKRGPIQTTLCRTYRVGKPGDRELRVRVGDLYDYHQSIGALVYLTYTD